MKISISRISPIGGFVGAVSAVACLSLLIATTGCQSTKGDDKSSQIGADVQMSEVRQVIQTQVSDPMRSNSLMGLVVTAERELSEINLEYLKFRKRYGKMSANHSKTAQDLTLELQESERTASARRLRLTNVLLSMRDHSTPEEWPAISSAFVDSVMKDSDRYQDNEQ